jgi:hypothetical protein
VTYGITVDWDYFVPENPLWDIQHAETTLHRSLLWYSRYCIKDQFIVTDEVKGFWDRIRSWADITDAVLSVSDSHGTAITTALTEVDTIVLFDQHHDCWPHKAKGNDVAYCDTWLRCWLELSKQRQVIWVKPEFPKEYFDPEVEFPVPEDFKDQFTCVTQKTFDAKKLGLKESEIDSIHICRSGAWTPPWLDERFIQFVQETCLYPEDIDELMDNEFKGMTPRWGKEDYASAQQHADVVDQMREPFKIKAENG